MFDLQNITYPQLVEEFRALGDRDAELELLLELGDSLPEFPQADKTEENRIHGCLSQAWVVPELDGMAQSAPVLKLRAGSDSQIVSGLIAVLLVLFRERAVGEAATSMREPRWPRLGWSGISVRSDGMGCMDCSSGSRDSPGWRTPPFRARPSKSRTGLSVGNLGLVAV
jgi:cysteine desulfuration protein SufE